MADIDKLFESINNEVLTEDVKLSMSVLFENSLTEAIKVKEDQITEANKVELGAFKEKLATKINDYLQYFAEGFVKDNAAKVEETVKVKLAEKIIKTFNGMINDFNVQLDDKKITEDVSLAEATKKVDSLTKQLIESRKEVKLREKAAIITESASTLATDIQKSKLTSFAAKLPFDELFEKKVKAFVGTVLTESKVKATVAKTEEKLVITEEKTDVVFDDPTPSPMDAYLHNMK